MLKRIIQISDLHFGAANQKVAEVLIADINDINPDLVIVSGDLTQRALKNEFMAAQKFLNRIDAPKLVIPGNHDIPIYNFIERFINPFKNYSRYINHALNPQYIDETVRILGANSVAPWRALGGYIKQEQMEVIRKFFCEQPKNLLNILVIHHNMIIINERSHSVIKNAAQVIDLLLECKIDIVLSGHLHLPYVEEIIPAKESDHVIFMITAGTAISTRLRLLGNSYNYIEVFKDYFHLEYRFLENNQFVTKEIRTFRLRS